jgi:small subunit ribosomal protein S19
MRSIWKGPCIHIATLKQVNLLLESKKKKKIIKVWSRASMIFPSFLGLSFSISNGKKFVIFCISKNMIGHRFGEFVPTKK